jgi:hypothetical protein
MDLDNKAAARVGNFVQFAYSIARSIPLLAVAGAGAGQASSARVVRRAMTGRL